MNEKIEETRDNVNSLVDRTRDAVGGVADRAEKRIATAAEVVVDRTHDASNFLREKIQTATSDVHRHLDDSATAIDRGYTRARADLSRAAAAATGFASDNPRTALMIAASAGFVLGVLAHRHRTMS